MDTERLEEGKMTVKLNHFVVQGTARNKDSDNVLTGEEFSKILSALAPEEEHTLSSIKAMTTGVKPLYFERSGEKITKVLPVLKKMGFVAYDQLTGPITLTQAGARAMHVLDATRTMQFMHFELSDAKLASYRPLGGKRSDEEVPASENPATNGHRKKHGPDVSRTRSDHGR